MPVAYTALHVAAPVSSALFRTPQKRETACAILRRIANVHIGFHAATQPANQHQRQRLPIAGSSETRQATGDADARSQVPFRSDGLTQNRKTVLPHLCIYASPLHRKSAFDDFRKACYQENRISAKLHIR
jgi:hypothetical protein